MTPPFSDIDLSLRDGRAVHIREISSTDEDELLQGFARLDPEALYMRFMRVVREPNVDRLRKLLASFPESGIGLAATVPAADGIDIVGFTYLMLANDRANCEFAITVAADYGGTGLGHALMSALIAAARARGLVEMEGFVLRVNAPMLRLASRLGFTVAPDPDDPSVAICRLQLDSPSTTLPFSRPAPSAG
ncbi:GNAT family N-acetyltransferase [Candidatus Accumulibacter sp. ACC003]|uniref:GNAT family N-acetyltransferase n=1 Tax=Candidatus Accumulibacter sp. ACC003 TaxID=2823334 RepID=UPI0025C496FF|nr:GNAT family N-acetyltransferase [Candidatus Accumulibacter sp. ACC003]